MAVAPDRRNLFIQRGHPSVVLTTHADTVPPFFPPRREAGALVGRGACDAKASLAAQAIALEELARDGARKVAFESRSKPAACRATPRSPRAAGLQSIRSSIS